MTTFPSDDLTALITATVSNDDFDDRIEALRAEAAVAGDSDLVALCARATVGRPASIRLARRRVAGILLAAAAMDDGS